MAKHELFKDVEFEALTETRVDAKRRVALGKILPRQVTRFRVYRNAHGQIVLDPMVSIPAHEAWLFKNKRASHLVRRGLEDARKGRLVNAKEEFSKHLEGNER